MSKVEIRQKKRIRALEAALRPFAEAPPAPAGTNAAWLYFGAGIREDFDLVPADFALAREALHIE